MGNLGASVVFLGAWIGGELGEEGILHLCDKSPELGDLQRYAVLYLLSVVHIGPHTEWEVFGFCCSSFWWIYSSCALLLNVTFITLGQHNR